MASIDNPHPENEHEKMSGSAWTTHGEHKFLTKYLPEYRAIYAVAREGDAKANYSFFWRKLYTEWFNEYPESARKFPGKVAAELTDVERKEVKDAIEARKKSLLSWFRWRPTENATDKGATRGGKRVSGKKQKAKLAGISTSRKKKITEVFSNLFYTTDILPLIQEHIASLPEGTKFNNGERLVLTNKLASELYEKASDDVKKSVMDKIDSEHQEHLNRMETLAKGDRSPEEFYQAIMNIREDLLIELHAVALRTGWSYSVLGGGPHPGSINGEISVISFHIGGVDGENRFGESKDFQDIYIKGFTEYLETAYPPEIRRSRVLPSLMAEAQAGVTPGTSSRADSACPLEVTPSSSQALPSPQPRPGVFPSTSKTHASDPLPTQYAISPANTSGLEVDSASNAASAVPPPLPLPLFSFNEIKPHGNATNTPAMNNPTNFGSTNNAILATPAFTGSNSLNMLLDSGEVAYRGNMTLAGGMASHGFDIMGPSHPEPHSTVDQFMGGYDGDTALFSMFDDFNIRSADRGFGTLPSAPASHDYLAHGPSNDVFPPTHNVLPQDTSVDFGGSFSQLGVPNVSNSTSSTSFDFDTNLNFSNRSNAALDSFDSSQANNFRHSYNAAFTTFNTNLRNNLGPLQSPKSTLNTFDDSSMSNSGALPFPAVGQGSSNAASNTLNVPNLNDTPTDGDREMPLFFAQLNAISEYQPTPYQKPLASEHGSSRPPGGFPATGPTTTRNITPPTQMSGEMSTAAPSNPAPGDVSGTNSANISNVVAEPTAKSLPPVGQSPPLASQSTTGSAAQPSTVDVFSTRTVESLSALGIGQGQDDANLVFSSTRSGRAVVPSKRNDQMSKIGTKLTSVIERPVMSNSEKEDISFWATLTKDYLLLTDLGAGWCKCVDAWFSLETILGFGTASGTKTPLPGSTTDRPAEWSSWTRLGRKLQNSPTILDSAEFGAAILKWWRAMQPTGRMSVDGVLLSLDEDAVPKNALSWSPLAKAGQNGMVSLIMLMVWWGRAITARTTYQEDSQAQWLETVDDITNVLVLLTSLGPNAFSMSGKRKADNSETAVVPKRSKK